MTAQELIGLLQRAEPGSIVAAVHPIGDHETNFSIQGCLTYRDRPLVEILLVKDALPPPIDT